jgi:hypothetical protein
MGRKTKGLEEMFRVSSTGGVGNNDTSPRLKQGEFRDTTVDIRDARWPRS